MANSVTIPFKVPAYRSVYEKMRYEDWSGFHHPDGRYKRRWKACQHYKCYVRDTTAESIDNGLRSKFPWSSLSLTSLGMYTSSVVNSLVPISGLSADCLLFTDTPTFRSQFGEFGKHNQGLPSLTVTDTGDGFVAKPVALGDLTRVALQAMLPGIKDEMSLLNTLFELKDIKSLFTKTLPRILSISAKLAGYKASRNPRRLFVKNLPDRLRLLYRSFSATHPTPTLRELRQGSADAYLQAQFNILPLLRDIAALSGSLSKMEEALRQSLSKAGRVQKRHYTRFFQDYESPATYVKTLTGISLNLGQFAGSTNPVGKTGVSNAHGNVFQCTRKTTHYQPTEFHAEVEYTFYYTQFQTEHAQLLALLDVLGVNLDPSVIWNAIPWSFVVDWVFSVGKWLSRHKVLNMEPQVSIHRYLWSQTEHRRTSLSFKTTGAPGTGNYWQSAVIDTYLPALYESVYRRDVELPESTTSLFGSGLSAVELSLALALANTPGRKPHTRIRL